jgi:hypothetical protein
MLSRGCTSRRNPPYARILTFSARTGPIGKVAKGSNSALRFNERFGYQVSDLIH